MRQAKENVNHSFSNVPRRGRFLAGDYPFDETLGPIKRSQHFKATYFNIVAYNNVLLCIFIFLVIPYTIQQCSNLKCCVRFAVLIFSKQNLVKC